MAMRKQYKNNSGGGLGKILEIISRSGGGGELEGAELNQPVSPDIQAPEYSGPQQFYSPTGEVVTTPATDTRNWWRRGLGAPNTASAINSSVLMDDIAGQQRNRFAQEGREQEASFQDKRFNTKLGQSKLEGEQENSLALAKQKALGQLAIDQGPQPNRDFGANLEPSQVDWRFQGQPETATKLPFMPDTTAGLLANQQYTENESQQRTRDFIRNKPDYQTVGNTVIEFPTTPGGRPEPRISVEAPFDSGPEFIKDANGNLVDVRMGSRVGTKIIQHSGPRKLGNIYGQNQEQLQPSVLPQNFVGPGRDQYYFPNSQQSNEFPVGANGKVVATPRTQGTAPQTEPSAIDYPKPLPFPQRRLRMGGNPQRLEEQIASETSPVSEPSEEEMLYRLMQRFRRPY